MKKNKAFTLVELLAVIVILAIILVIAIPQIINVIKASRISSFKDSAILIATNAEKDYLSNQVLDQEYDKISIDCSDVVKLNEDYEYCSIKYNSGKATIKLKGKDGGKFSNIICRGTKDNMSCGNILEGYVDAIELFKNKNTENNDDGLITDDYGDIRFQGSNDIVKNYTYFNCSDNNNPTEESCELWRIIGVFNVNGEDRVKLVRNDSLGNYSWDSSSSEINLGYGINQWGTSSYTNGNVYEGADLMRELNTDYLNTHLTVNSNWYNNVKNSLGTANFNINTVLKKTSQDLIDDALWYLGNNAMNQTLEKQYKNERESININNPADLVVRTDTWVGKVGLIYASDYAYASSNMSCKDNIGNANNCKLNNWLYTGSHQWPISPSNTSSYSVQYIHADGGVYAIATYTHVYAFGVRPTVYLISGVEIKGEGTQLNPYRFM